MLHAYNVKIVPERGSLALRGRGAQGSARAGSKTNVNRRLCSLARHAALKVIEVHWRFRWWIAERMEDRIYH
jgi:hypothetical protein